ncbi:MAG: phage protein Gp27 family protein [Candidatus Binataceae bacterium]
MPRRADISIAIKEQIETFLLQHNFTHYRELSSLLRRRGIRLSKTTLCNWGQKLRREWANEESVTRRTAAIARGLRLGGVDRDALESAAVRLLQTGAAPMPAKRLARGGGAEVNG